MKTYILDLNATVQLPDQCFIKTYTSHNLQRSTNEWSRYLGDRTMQESLISLFVHLRFPQKTSETQVSWSEFCSPSQRALTLTLHTRGVADKLSVSPSSVSFPQAPTSLINSQQASSLRRKTSPLMLVAWGLLGGALRHLVASYWLLQPPQE